MSTDDTSKLTELLADGHLAGLHFHTGGGSSRSTRAFVLDLANVLTSATGKKPIIATNDHALTAIYRFFQRAELKDNRGSTLNISGGQRFSDIDNQYAGGAHIEVSIALPEGGRWLDGKTPLTVARHELAVFDSTMISAAVEALLGRWQAAGKLVDIQRPAIQPRPSAVELAYEGGPTKPIRTDRFTEGEREALKFIGIE